MTISHRDSSPRVGQTIAGKFVIEAVVAVGGIGTVYRARQLGLDRVVALKLLREEFARDEDFLERFKREARAASRLEHINSVRVLDFGQHDDSMLYLAMEYVEGRTLYDVIRQDAPLPDARIVDILSQVLAAVGVAHDMGVVHRDLKPENIMIIRGTSDEGEHAELVKVLDFGIASLGNVARDAGAYAEGPRMTKRGLIVGTPEYMAPEQADGRADRRSDIYSLGVVLYQMLTGRLPFRGDSPLTVAVKHITEALELPSQIAVVNPKIEAVCVRALGKTPDERYGSAREMRSALRAAINLAPSRASAPQAVISADSQSGPLFGTRRTPLGQPSAGQPSGVYGRRRHASLVVGLALATLFAAALGARSWWVKSQRVPPRATPMVTDLDPRATAPAGGALAVGAAPSEPSPRENLPETEDGENAPSPARRNKAAPTRETRDKSRRTAHPTTAPRAGGKGAPATSPVVAGKGASPADDPAGAKTPAAKAGAAVTAPVATTPPPLDLGHASVTIASITSTSAIPSSNIRAALSRSPLVRCYREALHGVGAAAMGTAVLHLKIDIAGYVTGTELEGAQFLPGVKPCVEKATRGVRVKDVDTGDATADVTLTFACPP